MHRHMSTHVHISSSMHTLMYTLTQLEQSLNKCNTFWKYLYVCVYVCVCAHVSFNEHKGTLTHNHTCMHTDFHIDTDTTGAPLSIWLLCQQTFVHYLSFLFMYFFLKERIFMLWAVVVLTLVSLHVCLFVGCLTSQQQASVSQEQICSDNFVCCHTEIEAADQTFYLTQSQYTDTRPTCLSGDPIAPGTWQGSHWSANFEVTGMIRSGKILSQAGFEPWILPLEADTLTTRPSRRPPACKQPMSEVWQWSRASPWYF